METCISESEISNLESRDTSWADENTSVSSMGTSSYEVVSATDGEASDSSLEINDWTEISRPLDDATITDSSRASNRQSRFSGSSTGRSGGPGSTYSTGSSENPHAHAECTVKGGIEGRRENGTPIAWNNGSGWFSCFSNGSPSIKLDITGALLKLRIWH